ncbi:MAG: Dissimilatory sulfite reductase (Desulfoviridin), alpha/beta subunit [Parcubacteria group bacterium GW2011_GWC2_39_14]|nr:MAG: Dissimilatory sulfite reductase (Desulfoviridin), alpha/beta subunit [Parcubacteria group bacterium GW2011_GWC2_39_14]KKR54217.1 MAG: Dissimilatory sulfite reductase (Desulfoviridin), alpha/beta subunit [Parcubacteria group bacterium GW2011_GWA2_40_23]
MGHVTSKNYLHLQERLDRNAQGAPASEALFKILEVLFTPDEADRVAHLPVKPFTVKDASKRWKMSEAASQKILDELADKGLLLDTTHDGVRKYVLPPTMAGFFEFSMMRTDGRFDRKVLGELFYQYINVEDDFVTKALMHKTSIARTLVHEQTLAPKEQSEILDYERATHIIDTATCITVGTCYCRHKMEHVGKACQAPQDVCLTFNGTAKSLSKHGIAKEISKEEAHAILKRCIDYGLVQIGDNIQNNVNWICNCCGCCCETILAYKKLGYKSKINSSFFAQIDNDKCKNCGLCISKCPIEAISKIDNKTIVDMDKCIGCGVCSRVCGVKAIEIKHRDKKTFVPETSFERCVLTAIERGKLAGYIFDNYDLWTNEMLRHLLGILLTLSGAKFLLANEQLKSKFLVHLRKLVEKYS